jgi:hypothetical protein
MFEKPPRKPPVPLFSRSPKSQRSQLYSQSPNHSNSPTRSKIKYENPMAVKPKPIIYHLKKEKSPSPEEGYKNGKLKRKPPVPKFFPIPRE